MTLPMITSTESTTTTPKSSSTDSTTMMTSPTITSTDSPTTTILPISTPTDSTTTTSLTSTSTDNTTIMASTFIDSILATTSPISTPTSTTRSTTMTTSTPTSTTRLTSTTSSPSTSTTRSSTTTSSPSTSTTRLTSTTSVPVDVTAVFDLTFRIDETFDPALVNTNSPQFAAKAKTIRSQIEPLYSKTFKNFKNMEILRLRKGSTVVESNIYFNSNGPNVTTSEVKRTLLNGLSNLDFIVIPNSIDLTQTFGNSMPPVIASSLSMIWMCLLSLLLSLVLHF
ncbi:uncharacterized protein LOC128508464 [Clarias gariepinus]|uniref:uncharacterized protein LOC128508464 n=1 Tax=Clarias gariepinus TaxID=13013 RepID=UPI00234C5884|nr:uncharacterized protein LOC128508464 [Clarias gariepinus]